MPRRAPSVCGLCGHAHLAADKCSLIAARDAARKARFDKKRPNSSRRGYDSTWERAAKAFLAEPANRFCRCGKPAVLVAHIMSIRLRPDLRMERRNWRPSCAGCNALDAASERHHK